MQDIKDIFIELWTLFGIQWTVIIIAITIFAYVNFYLDIKKQADLPSKKKSKLNIVLFSITIVSLLFTNQSQRILKQYKSSISKKVTSDILYGNHQEAYQKINMLSTISFGDVNILNRKTLLSWFIYKGYCVEKVFVKERTYDTSSPIKKLKKNLGFPEFTTTYESKCVKIDTWKERAKRSNKAALEIDPDSSYTLYVTAHLYLNSDIDFGEFGTERDKFLVQSPDSIINSKLNSSDVKWISIEELNSEEIKNLPRWTEYKTEEAQQDVIQAYKFLTKAIELNNDWDDSYLEEAKQQLEEIEKLIYEKSWLWRR